MWHLLLRGTELTFNKLLVTVMRDLTSYNPTPRIPLFVGWLVRPSVTKKYRIVLANAYTMRTSSPMYDAVKMMMIITIMYDAMIMMMKIIIICVQCDDHHDNDHHHLCTMQ